MRPMAMLILLKAEEYTTCIQLDHEKGFQSAHFTVNSLNPLEQQPMNRESSGSKIHGTVDSSLPLGATVEQWLDYSPPPKAKRVRFPAGSIPDFRMWESCRTILLVSGFSQGSPVSPALALHIHLTSPSTALRTLTSKRILHDTCSRTWFLCKLPQGLVHEPVHQPLYEPPWKIHITRQQFTS
ncbi:hypothetical protein PR048_013761 [Dryococelus australis]|uniref:Uncharacterized protein n=1 Tax=Dryococelus australis TaxID=614101 RepID=A0ABQ9HTW7_9NEOP|nr:hypothetical protein PR048_013761 [Dryococelus australis]